MPSATSFDLDQWAVSYLRHAPLSLCLRELNRLLALTHFVPGLKDGKASLRILDIGCGDAFWWDLFGKVLPDVEGYGIDISPSEIRQAKKRIRAELLDISKAAPFPGVSFDVFLGNCSFEHIPKIHDAMKNLSEAAKPGAKMVLFVPAPNWAYQGLIQSTLLRAAPRLAMTVSGALNGFFQHWHLYEAEVWSSLLARHGWQVTETHGMGNRRSELLFRLFLPPSFVGFLFKKIFGVYPNRLLRYIPRTALQPLVRLLRWGLEEPLCSVKNPKAYEYILLATRS